MHDSLEKKNKLNMEKEKRSLLDKTIQKFIDVGFGQGNLNLLDDIVASDIVGIGTAIDEKIYGREELVALLERQRAQSVNMGVSWKANTLKIHISADENIAIYTNDVFLYLTVDGNTIELYMRFSVVMEYVQNKWLAVHWHLSKSEHVESEKDTWGIETWKQKAEVLEKEVAERTADLVEKNRELAIEAALEKVRAVALGMRKPEEMLDVCRTISYQLQQFGVEKIRNVQIAIINENIGQYLCYQYFTSYDKTTVEKTEYLKSPVEHGMVRQMLASRDGYFIGNLIGKELEEFRSHRKEENHFTDPLLDEASELSYCFLSIGEGGLGLSLYKDLDEDVLDIFKRFHQVFLMAYQRFRDIQKAEAQAREAQIEAAVERVRAQSMAIHHSDDLHKVTEELLHQLNKLSIDGLTGTTIYLVDAHDIVEAWDLSSPGNIGTPGSFTATYDAKKYPVNGGWVKEWRTSDQNYFELEFPKEALLEAVEEWKEIHPEIAVIFENAIGSGKLTHQWSPSGRLSKGLLAVDLIKPPTEDTKNIVTKMAGAFNLAYQRFEDLQKAEAQAREAQIEAALEKVRSRTMGMQRSDELADVANVLFGEMNHLVHNLWTCGFVLCERDRQEDEWWLSLEDGFSRGFFLPNVNDFAHATLYEGWLLGETFRTVQLDGDMLQAHYDWLMGIPVAKNIFDDMEAAGMERPDWQKLHAAYFSKGYLVIITREYCPEEEIFKRFATVFDQTYTRFLDLQKAEAQAREAQIENALEKVRSRSLAMQSPDELIEVVHLLREEMGALGVEELETSSIYIHDECSGKTQCWFTIKDSDSGKAVTDRMSMDLQDTRVGRKMLDFYRSDAKQTSILMQGEQRIEWIRYCGEKAEYFSSEGFYGESIPERTYHLYKFSDGYIGAASPSEISSESWDLLKRATSVFSFAYTRFLDLKKAKEQTREAQIELSLERIRSQVTAMQESSNLFDIVVSMRKEFISLGHEADYFWHMRWLPDTYDMSMTSEDGNRVGMVISIPKFVHDNIPALAKWEKGNDPTYALALDTDGAWDYIDAMNTHGAYELADPNAPTREDIEHIGGLTFIMARTTHGEIGYSLPGQVPDPPEDAVNTLVRFAGVFDLAYKRFEDLKSSEHQALMIREERDRLEIALNELRATQAQLVQQEKLASLGQLTAGIAHEIKNPLNFVNNFSEVSVELIDEAFDELEKLDDSDAKEEITAILNDVKSNLTKVHEHGSRADSIVKSMLQHSRGGSGKLEPTDLNVLIKEYVNLSFHGMRAKKNPINVEIDLQLDPKIKTVPLISEDFSRVVLNLCNNAFDALREAVNTRPAKLTVRTKKESNAILIELEDNGPGIPDEIIDKILQPFFTTKQGTEGTGLGLSITNDIIKAHGGELDIQSQPGSTNFKIHLNL